MGWNEHIRADRTYRYSDERRPSGRPIICQFEIGPGIWIDVRNIDTLNGLWNVANGLPFGHDHRNGQ